MSKLREVLERLPELKALAEKATPGPWAWAQEDAQSVSLGTVGCESMEGHVLSPHICKACAERGQRCLGPREDDAAFISASRQDVPAMAEALEEARTLLEEALAGASCSVDGCGCLEGRIRKALCE